MFIRQMISYMTMKLNVQNIESIDKFLNHLIV